MDQERQSAGVPQLRCVGTGIGARPRELLLGDSADALGDAAPGIDGREIELRARELLSARIEAESTKAERDRRLLDAPDRPAVVTERIVGSMPLRQGPDPP